MKKLDILLEKYKQRFGEPCIPNKLDLYGKKNRVKMLERILERGIKLEASPDEWMNYYESYFKKECPVPCQPFSVHDIPVADIKKALMENKPLPEIDWDYEHKIY